MGFGEVMFYIYLVNFLLLIVFICFERRDPVVSLAWVLWFTAVPVLGFATFLVFQSYPL